LIQVFGQGGNDTITLNESNGALPAAELFGGTGNDVLTGGSGGDLLFGQSGNVACTRFRGHRVRCHSGAGGGLWNANAMHESSSLRL